MADTFDTKPDNFSASGSSVTKYLDLAGLQEFWSRSKDYIDNQDSKLHNQLKAIHDKIKDISGLDIDDLLVIGKGDANNSAVLNGEYEGYSNKAISQTSMALGASSTAGLKGWYYTKVNLSENLIWLSDTRLTGILQIKISTTTSTTPDNTSFVCGWKVGDEVTIVNDKKYDRCAKITAINGNMIKLDKLPFDSNTIVKSAASIGNYNEPDEFSITAIKITDNDPYKTRSVSSYDKGNVDFGGGAHAEGVQTYALNIGAHAEGIQSVAHGQYSHAEGFRTEAAYAAHAEGSETVASGSRSHAEGQGTVASGDMSHTEGNSTKAIGKYSHAEGYSSSAEANASHAEGYSTTTLGDSSHAEGWKSIAKGKRSHAEGSETYAEGHYSHTEGLGTKTTNEAEHASGKYNKSTSGSTLFSVGNGASDADRKNAIEITSDGNVYIGETIEDNKVATLKDIPASITVDTELDPLSDNPIANSTVANAISGGVHFIGTTSQLPWEGLQNTTIGRSLDGANTKEYNIGDIIIVASGGNEEGFNEPTKEYILVHGNEMEENGDIIHGYRWVELGDVTPAQDMIDASVLFTKGTGTGSVIVKNRGCIADGQYSTVFGRNGRAYGNYSHIEGRGQGDSSSITKENAETAWDTAEATDGTGDNLHLGVGNYVHVEGFNNIAIGDCSHVEGQRNKAKGVSSHAEGWKTQSIGARSHAEGQSTQANGSESHAGGVGSIATGARSFVHGNYVNTTNNDEVAFGKYNVSNSNTLFSVGNGTSDTNRKNVFEVKADNTAYVNGDEVLTVDNEGILNKDKFMVNGVRNDIDNDCRVEYSYGNSDEGFIITEVSTPNDTINSYSTTMMGIVGGDITFGKETYIGGSEEDSYSHDVTLSQVSDQSFYVMSQHSQQDSKDVSEHVHASLHVDAIEGFALYRSNGGGRDSEVKTVSDGVKITAKNSPFNEEQTSSEMYVCEQSLMMGTALQDKNGDVQKSSMVMTTKDAIYLHVNDINGDEETALSVSSTGATINDQPILTGTRIEDSKILSLFS